MKKQVKYNKKRYVICDNEGDYIIATDNYDSAIAYLRGLCHEYYPKEFMIYDRKNNDYI